MVNNFCIHFLYFKVLQDILTTVNVNVEQSVQDVLNTKKIDAEKSLVWVIIAVKR